MHATPGFLVFICGVLMFSCRTIMAQPPSGGGDNAMSGVRKILWQAGRTEAGVSLFPGRVESAAGRFDFRWAVDARGFVVIESPGPAGAPAKEKVFLLVLPGGTSLLFTERISSADAGVPRGIVPAAAVSTADLFSVLPPGKTPPESPLPGETVPVSWGAVRTRNSARYVEGAVNAPFGRLSLYWKTRDRASPELVTLEAPGAGELPPVESPLRIWSDAAKGVTFIFQERHPLLNQGYASSLHCLAAVKTAELLAGLKRQP